MNKAIERALSELAVNSEIVALRRVAGGDINEAYCVETKEEKFFVKLNHRMASDFFSFEADGLREIGKTGTISVPKVYGVMVDEPSGVPMLWLEWVEGKKTAGTFVLLGEQLARLHLSEGKKYGWKGTTYIGRLKQQSGWTDDWITYYRDFRLLEQAKIGERLGVIKGGRRKKLLALIERLDEWIPRKPKASLLHGDLWGGNWIVGGGGKPYLIDPSVFYGDHEMEIAFTELFGGFSARFYAAYQSVFPLSREYRERKELYQLYYLLVHLNMFGEVYGASVDRILNRFV